MSAHSKLLLYGFLAILCAIALPAHAQAQMHSLSEEGEITLITILPGEDIPSMYGHSAFRVKDPINDIDHTYNYGTYDFDDPFFIPKFLYGDMEYFLGVSSYPLAEQHYRAQRRPIIEQVLNLTPEERDELFSLLQVNARPENRYYQYDFFFDNCSTRPRDVLDRILGDDLTYHRDDPGKTFRELIDPYSANSPFLDLGMDMLLGPRTDREASNWEAMFLPDHLMLSLETATVDRNAQTEDFVTSTDTLYWADHYFRPQEATNAPLFFAWFFFIFGVAYTGWQYFIDRPISPLFDGLLYFFTGIAGLLIFFLMFISLHDVTRYNLNILWALPTHLWAAWAVMRGRRGPYFQGYMALTAILAVVVSAGWFFWPQYMPPALLPIALLVAVRSGWTLFELQYPHAARARLY